MPWPWAFPPNGRTMQEAASGAGIFGPDTQATFSFLSEPEANLINFIACKAISTDFKVSSFPSSGRPVVDLAGRNGLLKLGLTSRKEVAT